MPKRRKTALTRPTPIQLPLFAEAATLVRALPERDGDRYYRLAVWPDLFGRALLVCRWGRMGTRGCHRLDPYPDPGATINALAARIRAKRRRGYRECTVSKPPANAPARSRQGRSHSENLVYDTTYPGADCPRRWPSPSTVWT